MAVKRKGKAERKKKWTEGVKNDEDDGDVEDGESEEELDVNIGNAEEEVKKLKNVLDSEQIDVDKVEVRASKSVFQIKKGDKIKVDGVEFNVDAHYILIDHGKTKEMTIEVFNPKTDKDYQLRYFSDNLENSLEFYELQEIVYVRRPIKRVEW